ncbi:MAG TPA: peptidoglycan DD-metalloendopeptidase family protein [Spongiibacteraceae bacterium]|nr:peptidoglycan DD-metalloendopeptidase family protein [Spongiibacteraceae bacterium]
MSHHLTAFLRSLGAAFCVAIALNASAADKAETRDQLDQIKSEMNKLQQMLQQFKDERSKLRGDLKKSELDISTTQKKIQQIEQQLREQQQELQKLQEQREKPQQSKTDQQQQIARQMRAAYELGQQNKLKALLNQEDPNKIGRAMAYYDYFNRARAEQIDAYIDLISKLDLLQPQIEQKSQELSSARAELESQRKGLLSARQERARTLAEINSSIQDKSDELRQRTRDREALEQVLRKIERDARERETKQRDAIARAQLEPILSGQPFRELRGRLPWPVAGKLANQFGAMREGGSMRWQGINIDAKEGDSVRAIHNGRVVFADWLRGSGLLIIVDHGDGYLSLYAHNQTLLKKVGEAVKAGDSIATVGNSGGEQHAGLYFEIRHKGVPTDPADWCRRG